MCSHNTCLVFIYNAEKNHKINIIKKKCHKKIKDHDFEANHFDGSDNNRDNFFFNNSVVTKLKAILFTLLFKILCKVVSS